MVRTSSTTLFPALLKKHVFLQGILDPKSVRKATPLSSIDMHALALLVTLSLSSHPSFAASITSVLSDSVKGALSLGCTTTCLICLKRSTVKFSRTQHGGSVR